MSTAPEGWVPAFKGQRPPFQPGHELSMQHGVHSPRRVLPLARELVDAVLADDQAAHVRAPVYRHALWAWARAEAEVQLLGEYLGKRGEESGDGVGDLDADRVRTAYLLLHRAETRATTQRTRLGLDPLSRARLGKDVASGQLDAARLMAELATRDRAGAAASEVEGSAVDAEGGTT